ncbi:MAG: tetratricopeptide repeat protein [Bacteroidetes bacterium]|nr:tetratricopeptide repeat protein [Bacteroidota bacterium]
MKEYEYKLKQAQQFENEGKQLHALQIYVQLLEKEESYRVASIRIALVYEKLKMIGKAYEILDKYLAGNSEDEEVRKFYGHFLIRQSNYARALDVLSGVSTEDDSDVFFLLGLSNFHLGENRIGQINFESFIKCNPKSDLIPESYLYLSKINLKTSEYDIALEYAKKSESFLSQNYETHSTQAMIYYKKEMYFHALDAVKRALTLNKEDVSLLELAGRIHYQLGEFKKAEEYLKEYVVATEPSSEVLALLGMTFLNNENHKEAERCFGKALKIDPTNQLANKGLEKNQPK